MSVLRAVVDTNVLVSAALNPDGAPACVVIAAGRGVFVPVVTRTILSEYAEVLSRPHFGFSARVIADVLSPFRDDAMAVDPPPADIPALPDPDDWPFIAAARIAHCPVITGNARHFPAEAGVEAVSPAEWLAKLGTV